MSEKNKNIEIEELLNAILDEEATERQKNEFDRLLRHDPSISEQIALMRRQRQVLVSLPVESAPEHLVEDVRSILERKQILGDISGTDQITLVGTGHLFLRRVLTTAAMLLVPVGLLSFVVYEIIKPPSVGPVDYESVGSQLASGTPSGSTEPVLPVAVEKLPFNGVLTFLTDQPITVSNYTEKMIFDQGLIGFTVPNRTTDITTYEITAPPEMVAVLVDSLETVWPRCRQVALSVTDGVPGNHINIPDVLVEQVKTLAAEDSPQMLNRLADQYASANINKDAAFASTGTPPDGQLDIFNSLPLTIPVPTGKYEPTSKTIDPSQPTIRLQIHIERATE